MPYRFNGANTITRTFSFGGFTLPALVQTRSQVDIDYYFGSYQYDVVSNTRAHFAIFVIPTRKLLNIHGEVNGMSLGSEGKYVQGNPNGGVAVLPIVRLQAGINGRRCGLP